MSMGVSPPPFHGGFLGHSWHHDPSPGGPAGLGQGAHLPGKGLREGGFGERSPPSCYSQSLAGPGGAGGSLGRRGGPGRRLAPPRRRRDGCTPPGRGADGRGEVGPFASPSLGGVTGSRGVRRAGGGPRRRGEAGWWGWSRGWRRAVKGRGAGNEWRLPVGIADPPGFGVSAERCTTGVPRSRCACGCVIDDERQLPSSQQRWFLGDSGVQSHS